MVLFHRHPKPLPVAADGGWSQSLPEALARRRSGSLLLYEEIALALEAVAELGVGVVVARWQ